MVVIFVLALVFFFFRQTDFLTGYFGRIFKTHSKSIVVLILNLESYVAFEHFKSAFSATLGQIKRDIFRAINASAEIKSALKIVPNWLKEPYLPSLARY